MKKKTNTNKRPAKKEQVPDKTLDVFQQLIERLEPPPNMSVSEWAEAYRIIPSEYGADAGKWVSKDYQIPIMDAFTTKGVTKVVAMLGAQLGKSEILFNLLGRYIHLDPCPMLMVQPTVEDSKDFSKERLTPTIEQTPVLADRIHDQKSRNGDNTILKKLFAGGYLALVGSNAPSGLAKRSIRILVCDEVDRFATSAGTEGDPVSLAIKRTSNFWNHIIGLFSTPTDETSRIYREYMLGTQEEWRYKCPNCGEWHWLTIDDMRYEYDEFDKNGEKSYAVHSVNWLCPDCGFSYTDAEMKQAEQGYIKLNEGVTATRSFHVNAFTSPWVRWTSIVQEYLEAKDDEESLKTFVNTRLAEVYTPDVTMTEIEPLLDRREEYAAELPDGALLLTCAVDTQDDRLEYEVCAWGEGEERWGIRKGIIIGTPEENGQVWNELLSIITREYHFKDGKSIRIARTFIDRGGHYSDGVDHFCFMNQVNNVFAIIGATRFDAKIIDKLSPVKAMPSLKIVNIGVSTCKQHVLQRLKEVTEVGSRYMHFPLGDDRGYDRRYFKGLLAERLTTVKEHGRLKQKWVNVASDKRNEPIDLAVYNFACMKSLNVNWAEYKRDLNRVYAPESNEKPVEKVTVQRKYGCIREGVRV